MNVNLPVMQCDDDCGECCGIVGCNEQEFATIKGFIRKNGIQPQAQGATCPFFQEGQCAIYAVRPWACRLFGHAPKLNCPRGYNTNLDPRKLTCLDEQYRRAGDPLAHLLHELVYPLSAIEALVGHIADDAECLPTVGERT